MKTTQIKPEDKNKLLFIINNASKVENKESYTCFKCPSKEICEYAWDDYNTNGDCLAEK